MDCKFTEVSRSVIESAVRIARSQMNTTVEPIHLFSALLVSAANPLEKVLSAEQIVALRREAERILNQLGRIDKPTDPQLSRDTATVLQMAATYGDPVGSHHLLLALLKSQAVNQLVERILGSGAAHEIEAQVRKQMENGAGDRMKSFAVEMVEEARKNKYDPVIGREAEIRQVVEILAKKSKSNAILVGKPGVGKTAIVKGIARMIAAGELAPMEGWRIYSVDVGGLVAGTSHRGEFEERLKGLVAEASQDPRVVLFIDEIHIVLGAGKGEGSLDAANILKPGLADGSLKVIGATTYDEFRKYVTRDPAFERRFARVDVREPSVEDTVTVLRGLRERLETHHGVRISDRALVYAATMGPRYVPGRRLPDLALDLIDAACASAIISLNIEPAEIATLRGRVWGMELEKTSLEMDLKRANEQAGAEENTAPQTVQNETGRLKLALDDLERRLTQQRAELDARIAEHGRERASLSELRDLKQKLEDARLQMEQARRDNNRYLVWDLQTNIIPVYESRISSFKECSVLITPEHVASIISRWTGIPVSRLSGRESATLRSMPDRIKERIFGQDAAVNLVSSDILSARLGLSRPDAPLASFLFVGPTGVGKTELAKSLAVELTGTVNNLLVLDMSDYAGEIALNKLIGAPAGYVGYDDGGSLTEPVKEMPHTVVLFDELDLAHQSVINVLYQLLDEGRVTDGRGVRVSFTNTVIIMTTNLGCETKDNNELEMKLINRFGQALINRIDNVVRFNNLERNTLLSILNCEIKQLNERLTERNVSIKLSRQAANKIIDEADGSRFGARIVKRIVKSAITREITKMILEWDGTEPKEVECVLPSEGMGMQSGEFSYIVK